MLRVLLVEDNTRLQDALASGLEASGDVEIVGRCVSGEEALEHCSMMMNSVCSCHQHAPHHQHREINESDLKGKSIDELEMYRDVLEKKLIHVKRLLERLKLDT